MILAVKSLVETRGGRSIRNPSGSDRCVFQLGTLGAAGDLQNSCSLMITDDLPVKHGDFSVRTVLNSRVNGCSFSSFPQIYGKQ